MKIIGKSKRGFIVEATNEELVHICGFSYEHDRRDAAMRSKSNCGHYQGLEIGDEIQIDKIWEMLDRIKSYENKLISAKATLAAVINGVDMVVPVVKAVAEFQSVAEADEVSRL